MKKKLFKAVSMMLTVALIGASVNLTALAKEGVVDDAVKASYEATNIAEAGTTEEEGILTEDGAYSVTNPRSSDGIVTWDCVYLGNYYQSNGTTKEPIKWRVLNVTGDDAFLLADQALDCKKYNETRNDVTWETCTLRTWLNGEFYNAAFNSIEQSAIKTTTVVNKDNTYDDVVVPGGNDTSDNVYLLSLEESFNSSYGFSTVNDDFDNTRMCKATQYAKDNGAVTTSSTEYLGDCNWWLRSLGDILDCAAYVGDGGCVSWGGIM